MLNAKFFEILDENALKTKQIRSNNKGKPIWLLRLNGFLHQGFKSISKSVGIDVMINFNEI